MQPTNPPLPEVIVKPDWLPSHLIPTAFATPEEWLAALNQQFGGAPLPPPLAVPTQPLPPLPSIEEEPEESEAEIEPPEFEGPPIDERPSIPLPPRVIPEITDLLPKYDAYQKLLEDVQDFLEDEHLIEENHLPEETHRLLNQARILLQAFLEEQFWTPQPSALQLPLSQPTVLAASPDHLYNPDYLANIQHHEYGVDMTPFQGEYFKFPLFPFTRDTLNMPTQWCLEVGGHLIPEDAQRLPAYVTILMDTGGFINTKKLTFFFPEWMLPSFDPILAAQPLGRALTTIIWVYLSRHFREIQGARDEIYQQLQEEYPGFVNEFLLLRRLQIIIVAAGNLPLATPLDAPPNLIIHDNIVEIVQAEHPLVYVQRLFNPTEPGSALAFRGLHRLIEQHQATFTTNPKARKACFWWALKLALEQWDYQEIQSELRKLSRSWREQHPQEDFRKSPLYRQSKVGRITQWVINHTRGMDDPGHLPSVFEQLTHMTAFRDTKLTLYDGRTGGVIYTHQFSETPNKHLYIVLLLNHAYALLPNRETQPQLPWSLPIPMLTEELSKPSNPYLFFYDIETTLVEDCVVPYAIGLYELGSRNDNGEYQCHKLFQDQTYNVFTGLGSCIVDFFQYLYRRLSPERFPRAKGPVFLYAHNGGAFDVQVLLHAYDQYDTIRQRWRIGKWLDIRGSIANLQMWSIHGRGRRTAINFKDSYLLLSASLARLCVSFQTEHTKDDMDHTLVTPDNWEREWVRQDIGTYLEDDCKSLSDIIQSFREICLTKWDVDPLNSATSAGFARKLLFTHFLPEEMCAHEIRRPPFEEDIQFRSHYFGGRTEAFYLGEWADTVYYYDFTSLYPSVQRYLMPLGHIRVELDITDPHFTNWYQPILAAHVFSTIKAQWGWQSLYTKAREYCSTCVSDDYDEFCQTVTHTIPNLLDMDISDEFLVLYWGKIQGRFQNSKPFIAQKQEGKLVFPHFQTPTQVLLWNFEMKKLCHWENLSCEALKFHTENPHLTFTLEKIFILPAARHFKTAIDSVYRLKEQAGDEGNEPLRSTAKIIINSYYGGFGYNPHRRPTNIITKRDSLPPQLNEFTGLDKAKQFGEYWLLRMKLTQYPKYVNIHVAACVTAASRLKLAKLFYDIEQAGGTNLYCDTDSVITNYCIETDPHLHQKYTQSKGLGFLTNEKGEAGASYSGLIVGGPKFYCLYDQTSTREVVRAGKIKGFYQFFGNTKAKRTYQKNYDHERRYIEMLSTTETGDILEVSDFRLLCLPEHKYRLTHSPTRFITRTRATFSDDPFQMTLEQPTITIGRFSSEGVELYGKGEVGDDGFITPYYY